MPELAVMAFKLTDPVFESISKSFDATSHFESDCADLLSLYKRVTGEELDMTINADSVEGDY